MIVLRYVQLLEHRPRRIQQPVQQAQKEKGAAAYIASRGQQAANQMCGLSTVQIAFAPEKLKALYKNKQGYAKAVETRLTALEKAGCRSRSSGR